MSTSNVSLPSKASLMSSGEDDRKPSNANPLSLDKEAQRSESGNGEKSQQAVQEGQNTPPDGGPRAWFRVLGCFLILANTMGLQSSFGVFQAFYQNHVLDTSASDIAWIGTVQIFCSSSGGLISGPLYDLGYDKIMILVGCFLAVFGYMMTSLGSSYYQIFLAQGVCVGLSGTLCFAPTVALTSLAFTKKRSLAVGITTSGFAFGAIIYPIVFIRLEPMIGFSWTTRVMGFIALGCFLVAYPLIYWKTPSKKAPIRSFFEWRAWKEPQYALYCFAVFFMYSGYWPPYFFITVFSYGALGTSITLSIYIFAISNAANAIARLTATILADRFGIIEVLFVSTILSAIIAFCWAAVKSLAGVIVWAIFWGYTSGAMSATFAAVVPNLSPDRSVVGTRLGMLNGLWGIGGLVSAPIAGAIMSAQGYKIHSPNGYLGMQMYVGACLTVAVVLFIYPLIYLRRQRRQQKSVDSD